MYIDEQKYWFYNLDRWEEKSMNSKLKITKIELDRTKISDFNIYPFNIEIIKNFKKLEFKKNVTFFIGENGIGKSTLIEALAIALGLPPEGGTQNFMFGTKNTSSDLYKYLKIRIENTPKTKFFLRAESFYNFSTEVQRLVEEDGYIKLYNSYGGNLHECSHGESFLNLVKNRFSENGLYILDEPEAALSTTSQMSLLYLIDELSKNGSQFIISTHSPILISYRDGEIIDLSYNFKSVEYKDSDIYKNYISYLDNPDLMQKRLFNEYS